jgi:TonB family protein
LLLIWSKEVPHDATRAADLLKRADAAGDPYASYYLSYLYSNGNGVPKDEAEGSRLKAKGEPAIDSIMREYSMKMRANIAANQHYPVTAAGHYSGKVQVTFTIEPPFAKDAHVTSSSGHADLDDAAIAAVYQTYYPSLPPGISQPENFVVQINFQ